MNIIKLILLALVASALWAVGVPSAYGETVSLVSVGSDGMLKYGLYANQGQSNVVNRLPDFSRAGYQGGGVPIPFVPAVITVSPGPGDNRILIQNAIDAVSLRALEANGFRGAVLLKAGTYEVGSALIINASGVVLRGEGSQAVGGTRIVLTATQSGNLIEARKSVTLIEVVETRRPISQSYVPVGAISFTVNSAANYRVGDKIIVHRKTNDNWITDLKMNDFGWTASNYQGRYRRVITAITGDTISIDAPIVQVIEDKYGGGDIYQYTKSTLFENVGIEALRLESTYVSGEDDKHGKFACVLEGVENGWVRQVTAVHFSNTCVSINNASHQITIEDCAQLDPKGPIVGGWRYSFNLDDCSYVLTQRCYAESGRHDYVSGSQTPGPNAFVDCVAHDTKSDSGPHHRYSTGQIYDNINCGELNVQNRRGSGSGHGWAGAQILFWNCKGNSICDAPLGAMNWSVGFDGQHSESSFSPDEPDGIWQSHNTRVAPRSLYQAQLKERMGKTALRNVILPMQAVGTIWPSLASWAGNGLFGDQVIVWEDDAVVSPPNVKTVYGTVRNLQMLDSGIVCSWTKVSGPGTVLFAAATSLRTTAIFSSAGTYVLRLVASGGTRTVIVDVSITASGAPVNVAPQVNAGADKSLTLPASASLVGTASDDGLPSGSTLTTMWSKVSGPGTVTFANASAKSTTATFSGAGTYVLRLTASDGTLPSTDDMSVTVIESGGGVTAPPKPAAPTTSGDGTATPTISGDTTAGATVHIFIDGTEVDTVIAGSDGKWTYPITGLPAGTHTITVTSQNAGGTSDLSSPTTITVVATGVSTPPASDKGGSRCGLGGLSASLFMLFFAFVIFTQRVVQNNR